MWQNLSFSCRYKGAHFEHLIEFLLINLPHIHLYIFFVLIPLQYVSVSEWQFGQSRRRFSILLSEVFMLLLLPVFHPCEQLHPVALVIFLMPISDFCFILNTIDFPR